jgi:hypothetical protein
MGGRDFSLRWPGTRDHSELLHAFGVWAAKGVIPLLLEEALLALGLLVQLLPGPVILFCGLDGVGLGFLPLVAVFLPWLESV